MIIIDNKTVGYQFIGQHPVLKIYKGDQLIEDYTSKSN